MVVLLLILTVFLCVLVDWVGHRDEYRVTDTLLPFPENREPAPSIQTAGFHLQSDRLLHPGHSWVMQEGPARVRVGIDDFARRLVGGIDFVDLPKVGDRVVQGKPAWVLHNGNRRVPMLSPITGEVVAVNPRIRTDAGLVKTASYTEGWLFSVRSPDLRTSLNNLLGGDLLKKWLEASSSRLRLRVNPMPHISFPDGGTVIEDISTVVDEERWKNLVREFLLTEPEVM